MIPKEQFCVLLREYEQLVKDRVVAHEAMRTLDPDFGGLHLSRHENMIVGLLQKLMDDEGRDSWICYWIYETDFGKKDLLVSCLECQNELYLRTPEMLYDFMTDKHPESI